MTEIQAAIASEQLKKLNALTEPRIELANYLTERISRVDGITPPVVLPECKHVYYVYPMKFDEEKMGISRSNFVKAVNAEGVLHWEGYCVPLYMLPMYQKRIVFGRKGCPFDCGYYDGNVSYERGICPITEKMYEKELFFNDFCRPPLTKKDLDDVVNAFYKVLENKDKLKDIS
ncbi:MAG: DegT/DnrJ/EryC1/StrS family aminotransferase [Candidatus Helarchaeota archaeon]|nr:DegT/DnrJ/EryC1/StrS family aminotransferase [Candidatus Helarchaeota archaeon]